MTGRSYEDAIRIIDSRRRQVRPQAGLPAAPIARQMLGTNGKPDLRGTPSLLGMAEWLELLGHSAKDVNALGVIHIAGTKGKGSTCAFTESILRAYGRRTGFPRKTGLYTSPHLILPEERIRISARPLDRELLAKYFFEVYDRLPQLSQECDSTRPLVERGPRYLQLWALLAFHVFIREGVDVAILETHNGGEYDATNMVEKPVVTAITTLGMDHVNSLGPSIENIAWHKAGIYKPSAVALSTLQDAAPSEVLVKRAAACGEEVDFISIDKRLPERALNLEPQVQRKNASLAVAAAEAFLLRRAMSGSRGLSSEDIRIGIEQWSWPGRFQIVHDAECTWFLDAAHNTMSVELAAEWFAHGSERLQQGPSPPTRVLVFSHINESRDSETLLASIAQKLSALGPPMEHAVFTTYEESEGVEDGAARKTASTFDRMWKQYHPHSSVSYEPSIQGAITRARGLGVGKHAHVLITGSQHLVGPALNILSKAIHSE